MTLVLRACPRCHEGAVQTGRDEWGDPETWCVICGYRGPIVSGAALSERRVHYSYMPTLQSAARVNKSHEKAADKRRGNPERTRRHEEAQQAWDRCLACRHNDYVLGSAAGEADTIRCDRRVHTTPIGIGGLKMPSSHGRAAILACEQYEERGA